MTFNDQDVEFEAFRGGGPGGQYRNKHACCIRARHLPTGIVAVATSERCLTQNKKAALANLKAKVAAVHDRAVADTKKSRHDAKPKAGFGQHVRTYRAVGAEQTATDHRAGLQVPIRATWSGRQMTMTCDRLDELMLAGRHSS